jgi:hypothetical protein
MLRLSMQLDVAKRGGSQDGALLLSPGRSGLPARRRRCSLCLAAGAHLRLVRLLAALPLIVDKKHCAVRGRPLVWQRPRAQQRAAEATPAAQDTRQPPPPPTEIIPLSNAFVSVML